jgi:molecular chaperone GrpE (heat shock protein)
VKNKRLFLNFDILHSLFDILRFSRYAHIPVSTELHLARPGGIVLPAFIASVPGIFAIETGGGIMQKKGKSGDVKTTKKLAPAAAVKKPSKPPMQAAAPEKPAPAAAKAPVAPVLEPGSESRILRELSVVRSLLERPVAAQLAQDAMLESFVDSLRRLLCELIEARQDAVVARLAGIRAMAATIRSDHRILESLDGLMTELGAATFNAQRLDYVDPFIHRVVAESCDESAPDGVVLETIQPGFRTTRGAVVAKAEVVVNRRG